MCIYHLREFAEYKSKEIWDLEHKSLGFLEVQGSGMPEQLENMKIISDKKEVHKHRSLI